LSGDLLQAGHKPGKPGKPGILRDVSEHGKLREFSGNSVCELCATSGKNYNKVF